MRGIVNATILFYVDMVLRIYARRYPVQAFITPFPLSIVSVCISSEAIVYTCFMPMCMVGVPCQTGDADSSQKRLPGLTTGMQNSINIHTGIVVSSTMTMHQKLKCSDTIFPFVVYMYMYMCLYM